VGLIIGIDPGITGAIAMIWPESIEVYDLPTMAKGKGGAKVKKQIDAAELHKILVVGRHWFGVDKVSVYLERVSAMPGQGVASMFSMGDTFGCIRGVIGAIGYPVEIITPQSWKKYYRLPSDKEVVRAKAIELFPGQPLGNKKDHNRAEALLIARFGREKEHSK